MFWRTYRSSLIQQYRAASGEADLLPAGYADAVLHLIRVVESHINETEPDAPVAPYNPAAPSVRERRHHLAFARTGQRV